jgi:hypothetical protein
VGEQAFEGIWGYSYVFSYGRLEEVRVMASGSDKNLASMSDPLRLKPDGFHRRIGLDGAIRVQAGFGDSEKTSDTIRLNHRRR